MYLPIGIAMCLHSGQHRGQFISHRIKTITADYFARRRDGLVATHAYPDFSHNFSPRAELNRAPNSHA